MDSNNCNQHKGANDVYKGAKKQAVIVDTKDPEKAGRVKVRISGVHPSDLPLEELPWLLVSPDLGSNMGQGIKRILQKGMFCEVESLTHSGSEWIISKGSSVIRKELNESNEAPDEDGQPFSNIVNGDLIKEFVPRLASTLMDKIMTTIYGYITRNLMHLGEDDVDLSDPPIKTEDLFLTATDVDFSLDPVPYLTGKNLGMFNNGFWYWRDEEEDDGECGNSMEGGMEMPMPGYEPGGPMEPPSDEPETPQPPQPPSGRCPAGTWWCYLSNSCIPIGTPCVRPGFTYPKSLNILEKAIETLYPKKTRSKEQDDAIQAFIAKENDEMEEGDHSPEDDIFSAAFSYTTELELTDHKHITGRDLDGNVLHPYLEEWNLIIPPKVSYGGNEYGWKEYEIGYRVTDREFPEKSAEGRIKFVVSGPKFNIENYDGGSGGGEDGDGPCNPCRYNTFTREVLGGFLKKAKKMNLKRLPIKTKRKLYNLKKEISAFETPSITEEMPMDGCEGGCEDEEMMELMSVEIPEYAFAEFPPESEKGQTENKDVHQLPNKLAFEHDGSKDNAYYSVKHPSGSRMEYFHDGRMNIKATDSFQLMSMKNLLVNSRNTMEVGVSRRINVHTLRFFLESEELQMLVDEVALEAMNVSIMLEEGMMIEGDVEISGELIVDGINFAEHVHPETGEITEPPMGEEEGGMMINYRQMSKYKKRKNTRKSIYHKKFR